LLVALLGVFAWGCDRAQTGPDGAAAPAADAAGAASGGTAVDTATKARFVSAYVEAACAVRSSVDLAKAVARTRAVYEKHGFNQLSYAEATKRWARDKDVQVAQRKGMAGCAPPDDKTRPGEGEGEGEGAPAPDSEATAGPLPKAIPKWAVPSAKDAAAAAEAQAAAKAAQPPSPYAGKWAGGVTSKDVTARVQFTVAPDGGLVGEVSGKRPASFSANFQGAVRGGRFILNGRRRGVPHTVFLSGAGDAEKGVVVGKWDGVIAKKRHEGTWRAARK